MSEENLNEQTQPNYIEQISQKLDADMFVYSGPIDRGGANKFLDRIECVGPNRRANAALILCTYGGDADAAFIMIRTLKQVYDKLYLYVFGMCKSAGTLIATGANEIIMSYRGEFGPLDVQLIKEDELLISRSGLEISKSLDALNEQAFEVYERNFIQIIAHGGGAITTKTAADIATSLAIGLISPITAQIDPHKVGEVQRAMDIAYEYGVRLGADERTIHQLIKEYPTHTFVIDFEEAQKLFPNVREPDPVEIELEAELRASIIDTFGEDNIREPSKRNAIVAYLDTTREEENNDNQITEDLSISSGELGAEITNRSEKESENSSIEKDSDGQDTQKNLKSRVSNNKDGSRRQVKN